MLEAVVDSSRQWYASPDAPIEWPALDASTRQPQNDSLTGSARRLRRPSVDITGGFKHGTAGPPERKAKPPARPG